MAVYNSQVYVNLYDWGIITLPMKIKLNFDFNKEQNIEHSLYGVRVQ